MRPDDRCSSELEGKTVMFTWNEEDSELPASFHESGRRGAAEGLRRTGHVPFLPTKEVAEGDTWGIDVKR